MEKTKMEKQIEANKRYRSKLYAKGWKSLMFILPPELQEHVRTHVNQQLAEYRKNN